MSEARLTVLLRLADTSLVLAQRLGEWVGHAPELEEDLGLANLALDLLGQARLLLSYAAECEGGGRSEDDLAFSRDEGQFLNFTLAEQPNGDFGATIVRQVLLSGYQLELYEALQRSSDARLAQLAAKSLREIRYHWRYACSWLVRLGDGTPESHRRVQEPLDALWPLTGELFSSDDIDREVAAAGITPQLEALRPLWLARLAPVLEEATLSLPADVPYRWHGKRGEHSEHLGYLLAELQYLYRAYPGARW